jgi:phage head maturation protease
MSDAERRFTSVPVEIRAGRDKQNTIGGYAAKFMRMSENLGGFKEQIAPGAFNRSASMGWPDVQARYNHDDNMLLGTTGGNSLRLRVERGDVRQSSFAFISDEDDWDTDDTGYPRRTLTQVRLLDVAPVNAPAYLDTSVGLRSLAHKFDAPIEDVRKLAEVNELTKFFKRTDEAPADSIRSAQAAYAKSLTLDPNITL